MYVDIHISVINNDQKVETRQLPISEWTDK